MQGFKAVSAGIITIVVLGLVNQLVVIMANVAYNEVAKSYVFLSPYLNLFTIMVGAIGFAIVMVCGGFITAFISQENIYRYSIIAALIASIASLWWSLRSDIFTPIALLFLIFGVVFSIWGSWMWKKKFLPEKPATD